MNTWLVFGLGCVGALAPEVVRLYSIRQHPDEFVWSWFYAVVSVLFALLGGLVAVVLPATTYWGAVYVGISTPVLVNTALRKGLNAQPAQLRSANSASRPGAVRSYLAGL